MFSRTMRPEEGRTRSRPVAAAPPPVPDARAGSPLAALVAGEPDPLLVLLPRGGDFLIEHASSAALRLLHLSDRDQGAATLRAVLPSLLLPRIPAACERVAASGEAVNQHDVLWAAAAAEGPTWVDLRFRHVLGRVTLLVQDVTGRHERLSEFAAGEARYRALAENACDLVLRTRGRSRLSWISPSVQQLLGYSRADVVGRDVRDLVHPDDLTSFTDSGVQRFDARLRHADGRWVWLAVVSRPDYDEDGQVVGRIAGAVEIGARKAADEDLRRAGRRLSQEMAHLRAVLDASLDPQVVLRAVADGDRLELAYDDCNAAAESYLGRSRADLQGAVVSEVHPGAVADAAVYWARRVMSTGTPLIVRDRELSCPVTGRTGRFDLTMVRLDDGVLVTWRPLSGALPAE